jgi:hypothetical protein
MHPGRAGSDHHPYDGEFVDIFLDQILPGIRAEIPVVPGDLDSRKRAGETGELLTIDGRSDVGPTVTNINADIFIH